MSTLDPCGTLIEEYLPILRGMARSFAARAHFLEAEDLVQEGCLRIVKAYAMLPPGRSAEDTRSYLLGAARHAMSTAAVEGSIIRIPHASASKYGVRWASVWSIEDTDLAEWMPAPATTTPRPRPLLPALRSALARLPEKQRITICLRYGLPTHAKRYPHTYHHAAGLDRGLRRLRRDPALREAVGA